MSEACVVDVGGAGQGLRVTPGASSLRDAAHKAATRMRGWRWT
jgi:hypothetical protein